MAALNEKNWEVETRQREAAEDFILLARRAAMGEDISADFILEVCDKSHKSAADFQQMVRAIEQREKIRKQADTLADKEEELSALRREVALANEALEAAVAEHQRITYPLQDKIVALGFEVGKLQDIPARLVKSCPSAQLQARLRRLKIEGGIDDQLLREMQEF